MIDSPRCFFLQASHGYWMVGMLNISKTGEHWPCQSHMEVLHGISALLKMEQTEPRIKAFLKKDGGDWELSGGVGVGCSLVNVVVIGVSSIDGRSQEWETQWKFPRD